MCDVKNILSIINNKYEATISVEHFCTDFSQSLKLVLNTAKMSESLMIVGTELLIDQRLSL